MGAEQQERHIIPPKLTATQREVGAHVLETLTQSSGRSQLVVIEGLSGVGKTFVTNSIAEGVSQAGGRVVDSIVLRNPRYAAEIEGFDGHLVTTETIGGPHIDDIRDIIAERRPELAVVTHILPGMNGNEIRAYMESLPAKGKSSLSLEEVATLSLGIPLLVGQLNQEGLSAAVAAKISAGYLKRSFPKARSKMKIQKASEPYLRLKIASPILQAYEEMYERTFGSSYIYESLQVVLQRQKILESRGIFEESPLFIAPESEGIYDAMLQSTGIAALDIFAPSLSPENFYCFKRALGFSGFLSGYDESDSPRIKMFNSSYRKVSFWHMDENGNEYQYANEHRAFQSKAEKYMAAYLQRKLHLSPEMDGKKPQILICSHDHNDMPSNPASMGWLTETFLQHRGIPYFVNNYTYGTAYVYNPESQHIEFLPEIFEGVGKY